MIDLPVVVATEPHEVQISLETPRHPNRDLVAERWNFQFGSRVECGDKQIGTTFGLTIDALTREMTNLVASQGVLRRNVTVNPTNLIDDVDGECVKVRPTVDLVTPTLSGDHAAPTLTTSTRIVAGNHDVGTLTGVIVDPATSFASDIVVRRGRFGSASLVIPTARVVELGQERLVLDINSADLDTFPAYSPDGDIASDVRQAIRDDEFLRRLSADFLDVSVRNGVVTVTGNIRASSHRPRVDAAVRRVQGVRALRNLPYGDDELEAAVAHALGEDPRTRGQVIPVQAMHGTIRLEGDAPAVALSLARAISGVRDVSGGSS